MRDMAAMSGKQHSYFGKIELGIRGLDELEFIDLCKWLSLPPLKSLRSFINIQHR